MIIKFIWKHVIWLNMLWDFTVGSADKNKGIVDLQDYILYQSGQVLR